MALQRKLTLCALTVGFLLCVYMLCVNLDKPLATAPLKPSSSSTRAPSGSRDSETSRDQWTHQPPELSSGPAPTGKTQTTTAAQRKPAEDDASKSSSRSDGADSTSTRTRTGTKGPVILQPKQILQTDGPTESPFIGDTYMSEDMPPQTDCPGSIRSRVSQTEFSGRFLKHIPVLQSAQHATREQHQRLSRYPGTHGWEGIDYETLVETLSVLNSSANRRLLDDWKQRGNDSECVRCAVVGNGGILKDSEKGEEIDGHHYVFRTNGAIIKGFEPDVGSRTTHYTFSTNTMRNSMRAYGAAGYRGPPQSKETRYVFLPDNERDYLLMKAAATHTPVERGPEQAKE